MANLGLPTTAIELSSLNKDAEVQAKPRVERSASGCKKPQAINDRRKHQMILPASIDTLSDCLSLFNIAAHALRP